MARKFRVSFIARIRREVSREQAAKVLAVKLKEKHLLPGGVLRWITVPTETGRDLYLKFSSVVAMDRIDDAWSLKTSKLFRSAGYGDLAWKITPVSADDASAEDTTCSIPVDQFQDGGGDRNDGEGPRQLVPPPLFGSDLFWRWIEDLEDRTATTDKAGGALDPLRESLEEVQRHGALQTICASCRKLRDTSGRWVTVDAARAVLPASELSHGICPECAQKLYPDLYVK